MGFLVDAVKAAAKTGKIFFDMATNGIDTTRVEEDVIRQRNEICMRCPKMTELLSMRQCTECGCILNVKTQLLFDPVESAKTKTKQYTKCPLGKW